MQSGIQSRVWGCFRSQNESLWMQAERNNRMERKYIATKGKRPADHWLMPGSLFTLRFTQIALTLNPDSRASCDSDRMTVSGQKCRLEQRAWDRVTVWLRSSCESHACRSLTRSCCRLGVSRVLLLTRDSCLRARCP